MIAVNASSIRYKGGGVVETSLTPQRRQAYSCDYFVESKAKSADSWETLTLKVNIGEILILM